MREDGIFKAHEDFSVLERDRPPVRRARLCPLGGFTMIEMIVVLVVISLTMAVVVPRVGSNWKQVEDNDFLREFTETIKRSRLWAMNSGHPVEFRLNGVARVYGFENPPIKPIPLNVEVFSEHLQQDRKSGDFLIIFHPDGSLIGNDVEVNFDHQRKYHIFIHPLFGTVSLARRE
jgi:prepilin-type N-terminal cleavage/methylation domain-containing protein